MKTADLVDRHQDELRCCELQLRSFGRIRSFHGPIATIKCHEDNALLKARLEEPGDGRVMVVDGGGSLRTALLGDQNALLLPTNGWAGIVIFGAVRDVEEIDRLEVGVKALGATPMRSAKSGAGACGTVVRFGGVAFAPGGWAYCDVDGVLVASRRLA